MFVRSGQVTVKIIVMGPVSVVLLARMRVQEAVDRIGTRSSVLTSQEATASVV